MNNYLTDSSVLNKEEPYFNRLFDFPSIALDNLNDYEIKGGIGKGAYAKVYQSKKKQDGKYYAIKVYPKDYLSKPHRITNLRNEIGILAQIKHPNIIKLYQICETADNVNIIMEYGGKVSLEKLIDSMSNKRIPEYIAARIFKQCLIALDFLHSQNIYHRDIKLGNVLVTDDQIAKLIDFGFSVKGNGTKLTTYCGTPCYMSPEILMKKPYNAVFADIWAMGVLLYRMVTGVQPFKGKGNDLRKEITAINYTVPGYVSYSLKEIFKNIFRQNPMERPDCAMLLANGWYHRAQADIS